MVSYCAYHVLVQPNFRRYYFYFLSDQAQILLDHFNVLDELWGELSKDWQQMKTFPIDPIVKIARSRQRYNVSESGQYLQWGSMGKFVTRCRIWMKFCTRVRLKPSNDRGEFELDRARSRNNIADNSFALGHETHNGKSSIKEKILWKLSDPFVSFFSIFRLLRISPFFLPPSCYSSSPSLSESSFSLSSSIIIFIFSLPLPFSFSSSHAAPEA